MYDRGYRVEVRNFAEIGYVSTQEVVALLRELQAGYRPDLVIFYDGVNDTTSAWIEGEAGVTTNEQNRRAEFNLLHSPSRLAASLIANLVRDSALYRFAQVIGRRLGGARDVPLRSTPARDPHELAAEVVRRYRANVAIVEKLGKEFGFETLFYWQPVVFDKRELTPYENEEARKFEWARGFFAEVYGAHPILDRAQRRRTFPRSQPALRRSPGIDLHRLLPHHRVQQPEDRRGHRTRCDRQPANGPGSEPTPGPIR